MISLGGKVQGCNLEVHDVQFVAANDVDETLELLRNNWYGNPEKLHLDSYKVINGADGYALELTLEKPKDKKQLYFVHLGGYKTESTQEIHEIGLFVGETEQEVKENALRSVTASNIQNHVDHMVAVETCLKSTDGEKYYINLRESQDTIEVGPDWFGYRRIDNY
jgi:hypothetical protein